MNSLIQTAKENVAFLGISLIVIIGIFLIAWISERLIRKNKGRNSGVGRTRKIAVTGMFSAIAVVLMLFEIPLPFAPSFYEIDFSEVPVLICSFALGPVAGVITELCKVLLKLVITGTTTAFVGDLANFIVGCSMVLPASIIYWVRKSKKGAIIGLVSGTVIMTVFGSLFNAVYLLPKFAQLYGMPMDALIGMGTAINSSITSVSTLVLYAVVPFNLLKGGLLFIITTLLYKHVSPLIKGHH